MSPALLPFLELPRAETMVWLGRLEESEMSCQAAGRAMPEFWFTRLMLAHVRGLRLLWQGDEHAVEQFLEAEQQTVAAGVREPCMIFWASHAIEAHVRFDHAEDARRVLEWLEACASTLPCRWPRAAAQLGRAALAADHGHDDFAVEHYRAALALHTEMDLPLMRTEALLAYGRFLRRHGRPRDARGPLAEARQLAETVEAAWLADTARRELQLAGGRRRRRTADRDQLTAAERRVAELAADGNTNAEIARRLHLSLSTIETHLRHVYSKLEIRSRRELQALAPGSSRRSPGDSPSPPRSGPTRLVDHDGLTLRSVPGIGASGAGGPILDVAGEPGGVRGRPVRTDPRGDRAARHSRAVGGRLADVLAQRGERDGLALASTTASRATVLRKNRELGKAISFETLERSGRSRPLLVRPRCPTQSPLASWIHPHSLASRDRLVA